MSGLALFLLGGCIAPLLILALATASAGMELDLHLSLRGPARPAAAPAAPTRAPTGIPTGIPRPKATGTATGTALAYAEMDIRLESALAHAGAALDRIIRHAGPQAALVAANTARRLDRGDTPKRQMLDFARSRLELLALGTDSIAAAHARAALGMA